MESLFQDWMAARRAYEAAEYQMRLAVIEALGHECGGCAECTDKADAVIGAITRHRITDLDDAIMVMVARVLCLHHDDGPPGLLATADGCDVCGPQAERIRQRLIREEG